MRRVGVFLAALCVARAGAQTAVVAGVADQTYERGRIVTAKASWSLPAIEAAGVGACYTVEYMLPGGKWVEAVRHERLYDAAADLDRVSLRLDTGSVVGVGTYPARLTASFTYYDATPGPDFGLPKTDYANYLYFTFKVSGR